MRHRQSRRRARGPPGQHSQPADIVPAGFALQPTAYPEPRLNQNEQDQLEPTDSEGSKTSDTYATRADNADGTDERSRDFAGPSAARRESGESAFSSSPSIVFFPPSDNIEFVEYPSRITSLETGSGAEEYEHHAGATGAVDDKSYQRAPLRDRRTRSEVIRTHISGLTNGSGADVQPALRARSVSDAPSGIATPSSRHRIYTDSLGPPDHLLPSSTKSSIILDGGEQQAQRHRLVNLDRGSATSPTPSDSVSDRDDSNQVLYDSGSRFALQREILASFQKTRNYQGHRQKFLPKEALHSLVNKVSVTLELQKQFGKNRSPADIQGLVEQVCTEKTILKGSKFVRRSYRKVFAILVLVGKVSSLPKLLEEEVSDLDLPLHPLGSEDSEGLCRRGNTNTANTPLRCFEYPLWSPSQILSFQDYQWKMLAPYFAQSTGGDVKHYPLEDQHILPFPIEDDKQYTEDQQAGKVGGFGRVFMVRIHKNHHDFKDGKDGKLYKRGFVIKQQLEPVSQSRVTFEKEIAVLKKFSGSQRHDHIVSLLATYEQFNLLHLVFYRAECDLKTYWSESEAAPLFTGDNVKWMLRQCAGIAGALLRLHRHLTFTTPPREGDPDMILLENLRQKGKRSKGKADKRKQIQFQLAEPVDDTQKIKRRNSSLPAAGQLANSPRSEAEPKGQIVSQTITQFGRHGDINPGNILWFKDSDSVPGELKGTMKLADFGQAELNSLKSRTSPRNVAHTLTYRPPECDRIPGYEALPIRQTYDMWCLGCVFLEFVTWMLGGEALLNDFSHMRLSPDHFTPSSYTDAFFEVRRNDRTERVEFRVKEAVHQFIDELHQHPNCTVVYHELLNIIRCDMLVPDSNSRASCEDISARLSKMLQKRSSPKYTARNPWKKDKVLCRQSPALELVPDKQEAFVGVPSEFIPQPFAGPWGFFWFRIRTVRAAFARELQVRADSTRTIIIQGQTGDLILILVVLLLDTLYQWVQSWG